MKRSLALGLPLACPKNHSSIQHIGGKSMKRLLLWAGLIAFLLVSSAFGETLTVLHLNDTHAHLLPYGPKDASGNAMWGGMARVATLVGMNRATEPNVMLLNAGDISVGDFMFQKYLSIPELEIMKALGYDALTLGNHEFDLYSSTLKYELNAAGFPASGFPVLCANLDMTADPEMGYFVQPYTIKQYGAVRVGIFGLTTDATNSQSNPQPLSVIPPLDVAQKWIDSLKIGHGCNVVILLSHLGIDMDEAVASYTSGIDVIVGGHSHTKIDQPIKIGNTIVVQAGEFAHYLGKLHLFVNGGSVTGYNYQLMPVDQNVPAEPTISGMLASLAAGVEADPRFGPVFSAPIARAAIDLDAKLGNGLVKDNPVGNLVSDAFRGATGTDMAVQPQGFISQDIWAGAVVGNDVFRAVPYGFDETSGLGLKLATFQTSGASLLAGLEFAVYYLPYAEDFFMHGSNVSFAYTSTNPAGSRVDYSSVTINGQPVNPYRTYSMTVPDGVVPFLSQIPGFNMSNLVVTDKFMYTVVKDFMVAHSPVAYYRQGRVLDLAALTNPAQGAIALADLVGLYRTNGFIKRSNVSNQLIREYDLVARELQRNHPRVAIALLYGMNIQIRLQAWLRGIDGQAAQRLVYLNGKLIESIRGASGFAAKEDGNQEVLSAALPESFELKQNYPNPFNPSTNIEFTLPVSSVVTLEVFNIMGQRVRTLVNEPLQAGVHQVVWNSCGDDGQRVASGVYFYRIQADQLASTRKMVLLK
jgi:5'-nucleotidase / UDP-sugar diphosphatase